jgi:uncharacterized membrane protein
MKKILIGSCMLTLVIAAGCNGTTTVDENAGLPGTSETAGDAITGLAEKLEAGEAEQTFSLSIPFESVALVQGGKTAVRIGINRGENFGEKVAVKISGLPKGVDVETKDPIIAQGSTGVELTLTAASDAALGDFTATVTGQTDSSGADFSKEIKITVSQK